MIDPIQHLTPEVARVATPRPARRAAATGLVYGGMFVLLAGSFLPWMSVPGVTEGGVQTDGLLTLVLAIAAGPLGFLALRGARWAGCVLFAVAVVAGFVVTYDIVRIVTSPVSIGPGPLVCGVACAALLAGAIRSLRDPVPDPCSDSSS